LCFALFNPWFVRAPHYANRSQNGNPIHCSFSILLSNKKVNQICFVKILFHLLEVAVGIDFAREKKMFLTGFTHRKAGLWKSCELDLWHKLT
jgi:hypothetical protein